MKPRVLLVDDEADVLRGIKLHLGRDFDITTARDGEDGLRIVGDEKSFAVVLSDMRMPGINGATFLTEVKKLAPDAVRMLLTGYSDLDAAAAAVNEGEVFRFLQKPCPPEALRAAFDAAVEHHRLVTGERVLLEQTLRGAVGVLTDVLALSNPVAFGKADRIKGVALELARVMHLGNPWYLEVAAMLSQIGCVSLPAETADRYYRGNKLSAPEQEMIARLPDITRQLLEPIPRLEPVLAIQGATVKNAGVGPQIMLAGAIYRVAADFITLEDRGLGVSVAISAMRGRSERYSREVLEALATLKGAADARPPVRSIRAAEIETGMVFAEDIFMSNGMLFAARGYRVTNTFVERVANLGEGVLREPMLVEAHDNQIRRVRQTAEQTNDG